MSLVIRTCSVVFQLLESTNPFAAKFFLSCYSSKWDSIKEVLFVVCFLKKLVGFASSTLWTQSSHCFWWSSSEEQSPCHLPDVYRYTPDQNESQCISPFLSIFPSTVSLWDHQHSPCHSGHPLDITFECEANWKVLFKTFLKIPFAAVQTLSKGWIADLLN